jgi:pimeloyl-ACP methyl ester carboxylesterase
MCIVFFSLLIYYMLASYAAGIIFYPRAKKCPHGPNNTRANGGFPGGSWLHHYSADFGEENPAIDNEGLDGKKLLLSPVRSRDYHFPDSQWTFITASDYHDVSFPDRAGRLTIRGWLADGHGTGNPLIIFAHGWGMCRNKFENIVPANMLYRRGFNLLLFDFRNHGLSGDDVDKVGTFGPAEHLDILGAYDYAVSLGFHPDKIGLQGVSFGGGATMMALAAQTTPRIKAAWLDSPVCERDEVLARNTMMVMPVLSIGAAKSVAELSTSFADSWTPHDLYSPTQIGSMASLDSSQSVYMVSTTGDETVPWYTSKPCRDAAIASGAATSFHLYDDRVDFDSDREDSPIYTEETTSFYSDWIPSAAEPQHYSLIRPIPTATTCLTTTRHAATRTSRARFTCSRFSLACNVRAGIRHPCAGDALLLLGLRGSPITLLLRRTRRKQPRRKSELAHALSDGRVAPSGRRAGTVPER